MHQYRIWALGLPRSLSGSALGLPRSPALGLPRFPAVGLPWSPQVSRPRSPQVSQGLPKSPVLGLLWPPALGLPRSLAQTSCISTEFDPSVQNLIRQYRI